MRKKSKSLTKSWGVGAGVPTGANQAKRVPWSKCSRFGAPEKGSPVPGGWKGLREEKTVTMTKTPLKRHVTHRVTVLWKFAPEEEKNEHRDQGPLPKGLLHMAMVIWKCFLKGFNHPRQCQLFYCGSLPILSLKIWGLSPSERPHQIFPSVG